ncbi:MAG: hypothetical protein V4563_17300 [Pseudomonadota bacterium]
MARTPAIKPVDGEEKKDDFDNTIEGFRATLGAFGTGAVKISRKNPRTQKYEYVNKVPIAQENFDQFTDQLREDYPEGGEFMLQLIDAGGRVRSNATLALAALPEKDRKQTLLPPLARDNDMLMMMMQMQQQSSRDNMQMMMAQQQAQANAQAQAQASQMALITALIPAVIPLFSNKSGDSPTAMFAALAGIVKDMTPKTDDMEKTINMLRLAKELLPDSGGGGDEGLGGMLKGLMPMLAPMMAGAMQQAQQPPQPGQQQALPAPIAAPQMQPVQQSAPVEYVVDPQITAPQLSEEEQQTMLELINKYRPFMTGVKEALESGADADSLLEYVESCVEKQIVSDADVDQLFDAITKNPQQLGPIAGIFGITDPEHISIIADAIRISGEELEDGGDSDGNEGDKTSPDVDGGDSEKQPPVAASADESLATGIEPNG